MNLRPGQTFQVIKEIESLVGSDSLRCELSTIIDENDIVVVLETYYSPSASAHILELVSIGFFEDSSTGPVILYPTGNEIRLRLYSSNDHTIMNNLEQYLLPLQEASSEI